MADIKEIVVRFRAEVKELEKGIQQATEDIKDFGKETEKSISKIDWNKAAKGGVVLGTAMTGVAIGAEALIERNNALNKSLSSISITTGIENKRLREMTFELADASTSVDDTAAALDALTRAGITNEQDMMKAAKAFFTLGDATGIAEDQLIQGLIPALKAFNIPVSEMGAHMDTITYLLKTTNYDFGELAKVFEKTAPKANALGVNFNNIAAVVKILSERGVDGGTAITMITDAMRDSKTVEDFYAALLIDPATLNAQSKAMGEYAGTTERMADAANKTITPAQEAAQALDEMGLQAGEALGPLDDVVAAMLGLGPSITAISTGVLAINSVGGLSALGLGGITMASVAPILAVAAALAAIALVVANGDKINKWLNDTFGQSGPDIEGTAGQQEATSRHLYDDYGNYIGEGHLPASFNTNPGDTNPDIAHDQETGNYTGNPADYTTPSNGGCFIAGTPITMHDGTKKPIEYIKEGDVVLSFDPMTGEHHAGRVAATMRYQATMLTTLSFEDGSVVKCTGEHPFYVGDSSIAAPRVHERFVRARDLSVGDTVVRASGSGRIREIVTSECDTTVYNFNVVPWHTYIASGCLVHNVKTMMAEGGIVTSPTAAIIGEAGPEAVIPLDRLGAGGTTTIIFNVDGYTLARAVIPHLKAGGKYNCGVR